MTAGGGFSENDSIRSTCRKPASAAMSAGARIELVGPLRVRLDYRVFKFGGDSVYQKPQRFSVGLNLAF